MKVLITCITTRGVIIIANSLLPLSCFTLLKKMSSTISCFLVIVLVFFEGWIFRISGHLDKVNFEQRRVTSSLFFFVCNTGILNSQSTYIIWIVRYSCLLDRYSTVHPEKYECIIRSPTLVIIVPHRKRENSKVWWRRKKILVKNIVLYRIRKDGANPERVKLIF